jgi:hypothetical protein
LGTFDTKEQNLFQQSLQKNHLLVNTSEIFTLLQQQLNLTACPNNTTHSGTSE